MRWKAHFFINGDSTETKKETYGFKSKQCPSQINELDMSEKDLLELTNTVKFRNRNDKFQNEMKDDINKIKSSLNVFIPEYKTTNMCETNTCRVQKTIKRQCNENLQENTTPTGKNN